MKEALTYEKLLELFAETDRKRAEYERQAAERSAELDRKFAETDRIVQSLAQSSAETDRIVKSLSQQLGGISDNNGSVAEEYFYNSFSRTLEFAHEHFDYIEQNFRKANRRQHAEFDIIMYNGKSVAIIEVKYKVHKNDIPKALAKIEQFRDIVGHSKGKTIYLGLAGLSFPKAVEAAVLESGIAVIKQVGDNMVVLDKRVKKF